MAVTNAEILNALETQWGSVILESNEFRGELAVRVAPHSIATITQWLREHPQLQYIYLVGVTGVDYLGRDPRFEVVYHIMSFVHTHRFVLKVGLPEDAPHVPSLTPFFPTANYQEREAFDMFGIIFDGHPDLQRILMPEDWDGHPQRKDEPLVYEEVAFSFNHAEIDAQKPYARE